MTCFDEVNKKMLPSVNELLFLRAFHSKGLKVFDPL